MSEIKNISSIPLQQQFNKIVAGKLPEVFPGMLDGHFICAPYPAGFNYGVTYGNNSYYNEDTLSTLDSTIQTDVNDITSISNQKLSNLYAQVLKSSAFIFSKDTQKQLNEWDNAAESQIASVIKAFLDSNFKFSDPLPAGGKIADIFNQLTTLYGPVTENCDNLPPYLNSLRNALSTYIELSGQAYRLHSRCAQATAILNAAIKNTTAPCAANKALQTGDASYYVGFDKLPTANELIGKLGTNDNSFSIKLSGDVISESDCKIHIDSSSDILIPIINLLTIEIDHSATTDISQYMYDGTSFSMDITYAGLTMVADIPLSLSNDNKRGWYTDNILNEIKNKTNNPDTDGYKLLGSEFSTDELFGSGGRLNYFKTFVISRQPTITATFNKINIEEFRKHIHTDNSVNINLFGFIPIGSVDHSYTLDEINYNESEQSVTITFRAPDISGTIPLSQQVAYVLGGVPNYAD